MATMKAEEIPQAGEYLSTLEEAPKLGLCGVIVDSIDPKKNQKGFVVMASPSVADRIWFGQSGFDSGFLWKHAEKDRFLRVAMKAVVGRTVPEGSGTIFEIYEKIKGLNLHGEECPCDDCQRNRVEAVEALVGDYSPEERRELLG